MFRVGMKVVCVDDAGFKNPRRRPKRNEIFFIRSIFEWNGKLGLRLEEIILPLWLDGEEQGFFASRFRPARTTDISIFEAMLVPTPKEKVEA